MSGAGRPCGAWRLGGGPVTSRARRHRKDEGARDAPTRPRARDRPRHQRWWAPGPLRSGGWFTLLQITMIGLVVLKLGNVGFDVIWNAAKDMFPS
ncbi:hypothetical protein AB0C84_26565 [Actinomadura sp. NPDC048955]|uniref:hypothetical protein n=1 Tax=Actinomadura sp. NPDC048955 TaxID=3158228 RepID=UPI0033DE8734